MWFIVIAQDRERDASVRNSKGKQHRKIHGGRLWRISSGVLLATLLLVHSLWRPEALAETFADTGFASELVATLPAYGPVGVASAPDGRLFIWSKNGIVRVFKDGALLPTPFLDFSSKINTYNDNGMLGLAFDPDFLNNRRIYLTYIFELGPNPDEAAPKKGRLVRVTESTANPDVMLSGSEVIILDNFPSDFGSHVLGTIRFASDGTMFFGNGDGSESAGVNPDAYQAQNLDSVRGKIFRVRTDGSAPPDNPFYDGTDSIRSKVWCYGVRNPYRFSLHPITGEPCIADTGWHEWEEINRGVRGGNLGWPCYEGPNPQPQYGPDSQCNGVSSVVGPIHGYAHDRGDLSGGGTCIVGGDFYTGHQYPLAYQGNYFYGDYSGNWIHRLVLDANGMPIATNVFATGVIAPTCIEEGPDGLLYYVSFTSGQIRRIRYNGVTAVASASPTYGYSPLQVSFSSAGSTNFGGGALTYSWNFGDGTTSSLPNPVHTYTIGGVVVYTATLTVRNVNNQASSASVKITVGSTPPDPTISTPADGTAYAPGQTVSFQGEAMDPDEGQLPSSALKWTVLLHHGTHVHTVASVTGPQGSFVAEDHGPAGTFYYELLLTATDGSGLAASTSVSLPVQKDSVPPTAPTGLTATGGDRQVSLRWNASTDDVAVAGYRVERRGGGSSNFVDIGGTTNTTYLDSGLAGNATYDYRVRAIDPSGNSSAYSAVVSATTTTPPTPSGLVGAYGFETGTGTILSDDSGNSNNGNLSGASWTNSGKYGSGLVFNGTSSKVTINDSPSLRLTTAMTLEAWVNPSLVNAAWRDVIYKADDNYYLEATSTSGGAPGAGGTFASSPLYGSASLPVNAWSHLAVTYDGSAIRLYVNGGQVASRGQIGAIQTSANPLQIGGDNIYGQYFRGMIDEVRVYNRALSITEIQSDMNTPVTSAVRDTNAPTAPTGLIATAASGNQINLSWNASSDNIAVTLYRIERCQGVGCSNFQDLGTNTTTTYTDTGLTPGTSYSYRVRAGDAAGNFSPYSSVATATTQAPDTTPPTAPANPVANAASSSLVNLSWGASTDNVAVTGYVVERCQGGACTNFSALGTTSSTTFGDTAVTGNTTYRYRVRATDAAGNPSPYSAIASATTPAAPTALVAAYGFNEGAGTSVGDASGNNNVGAVSGAAWTTSGKYGKALVFNGSSSRVTINDSPSVRLTTAMTLEAWVNPSIADSSWRDLIYKGDDNYYLEATSTSGGAPGAGGTFAASPLYGTAALLVNTWSHLAVTYDGSTIRLYVNGAQVASRAETGAIEVSANPLQIGGDNIYGQYFQGIIDEVRVYNRALSAAEIQADMNSPL
jgi:glucose/arabinose dehydrogenase/chitodextrinase